MVNMKNSMVHTYLNSNFAILKREIEFNNSKRIIWAFSFAKKKVRVFTLFKIKGIFLGNRSNACIYTNTCSIQLYTCRHTYILIQAIHVQYYVLIVFNISDCAILMYIKCIHFDVFLCVICCNISCNLAIWPQM